MDRAYGTLMLLVFFVEGFEFCGNFFTRNCTGFWRAFGGALWVKPKVTKWILPMAL
jgi:hypothetical protein